MNNSLYSFELEKGRIFVAGLFWQALSKTNIKDAKKEALEIAEQISTDLCVFRQGEAFQVGLGSNSDGGEPGMMSVAAMISKTLEVEEHGRDALIAVPIGEDSKWLYFAQKDGVILSDGDFVGAEDEVRSAMLSHYAMAEWTYIICPSFWMIKNSQERSFEDFLPKTKAGKIRYHKWWKLQPIKVTASQHLGKIAPLIILASIFLGLAFFGFRAYSEYEKNEQEKLRAQNEAEAARKAAISMPPPWEAEPSAIDTAERCVNALKVIDFAPGGWIFKEAVCTKAQLALSWTRPEYSSLRMLKSQIPDVVIAGDNGSATFVGNLPAIQTRQETVLPLDQAIIHLVDQSQRLGLVLQLSMGEHKSPPEAGGKSWASKKWAVSTALTPSETVRWLNVPGLRVDEIHLGMSNGSINWKIEGHIYGK